MNGSHVSLRSAPLRTPLTRSALSVEAGQPTACAISLSVQRRMPYSSESCIKHITLIQTPFSACVQRRKLLFACQSAGENWKEGRFIGRWTHERSVESWWSEPSHLSCSSCTFHDIHRVSSLVRGRLSSPSP